MLKSTSHRWVIGVFLAACLMVVTGAAVASSATTTSTWPAKCKTVTCVNRYLNSMHLGNVVRSGKIATLQSQMVANSRYHAVNRAEHAGFTAEMAAYDKTIADMKATIAGYDKTIADLKTTVSGYDKTIVGLRTDLTAAQGDIALLQAWKTNVKANLSHLDVTVDANGFVKTAPTAAMYMLLFEKSAPAPAPIFP
jgi:hypothetical protein